MTNKKIKVYIVTSLQHADCDKCYCVDSIFSKNDDAVKYIEEKGYSLEKPMSYGDLYCNEDGDLSSIITKVMEYEDE